jgi:hypothetical protein
MPINGAHFYGMVLPTEICAYCIRPHGHHQSSGSMYGRMYVEEEIFRKNINGVLTRVGTAKDDDFS